MDHGIDINRVDMADVGDPRAWSNERIPEPQPADLQPRRNTTPRASLRELLQAALERRG